MERVIYLFRKQPVALYRQRHAGGLEGDLDIPEVHIFEYRDMAHRALDEGLGGGVAVLREYLLFERPGVDAYANRDASLFGGPDDLPYPFLCADVAGVQPQPLDALVERGEREPPVEVYV